MKYKSKKRFPKTKTRRRGKSMGKSINKSMGKSINKSMSKSINKSMSKSRRTINQKGGLFNMSLGLNGTNLFGKTYGKKYYDNGVWKNQTCSKIFGFEYCTLDKETEQP